MGVAERCLTLSVDSDSVRGMKTLINFRLEPEEHERLREIARAQERSIATVIRRALAPLLQARPARQLPPKEDAEQTPGGAR